MTHGRQGFLLEVGCHRHLLFHVFQLSALAGEDLASCIPFLVSVWSSWGTYSDIHTSFPSPFQHAAKWIKVRPNPTPNHAQIEQSIGAYHSHSTPHSDIETQRLSLLIWKHQAHVFSTGISYLDLDLDFAIWLNFSLCFNVNKISINYVLLLTLCYCWSWRLSRLNCVIEVSLFLTCVKSFWEGLLWCVDNCSVQDLYLFVLHDQSVMYIYLLIYCIHFFFPHTLFSCHKRHIELLYYTKSRSNNCMAAL